MSRSPFRACFRPQPGHAPGPILPPDIAPSHDSEHARHPLRPPSPANLPRSCNAERHSMEPTHVLARFVEHVTSRTIR
jgi:hypothetical protein